MIILLYF